MRARVALKARRETSKSPQRRPAPAERRRRGERRPADRAETQAPGVPTLAAAARDLTPVPLPHRSRLEARFQTNLSDVPVMTGDRVAAALEAMGADAATVHGTVFLPSASVPYRVMAHEIVHVLQYRRRTGHAGTSAVLPADAPAEREASAAEEDETVTIASSLPSGTVALLRSGETPSAGGADAAFRARISASERSDGSDPDRRRGDRSRAAGGTTEPAPAPSTGEGGGIENDQPNPTFRLPVPPATELSPAEQARREAEVRAAEEALAAADSPSGVVDAYAEALPSVKARHQAGLGAQIQSATETQAREFDEAVPDLHAEMGGRDDLPAVPPIETPEARRARLEASEPPAPRVDLPPEPAPPRYAANDGVRRNIDELYRERRGRFAPEDVADTLSAVRTTDPGIETSAGPAPRVPLEGAADPARQERQQSEAARQAGDARTEAQRGVIEGPGPETVQLRAMDEAYSVETPSAPEPSAVAPSDEAQRLETMALPAEVTARFDADNDAEMRQSLDDARTQLSDAEATRDRDRDAAVDETETQRRQLVEQADGDQRNAVLRARETIQEERQSTVDEQSQEVRDFEREAEGERGRRRRQIDDRVDRENRDIERRYGEADRQAEARVSRGEQRATAARREAERDAEEESWWDRAVNFVRRAFAALTAIIGRIFDEVRSAVRGILNAVRSVVRGLIDAAAAFITGLIRAFADFLISAINTLLGSVFPRLAAALTAAIDRAANAAIAAVNAVADWLRAGVDALLNALQRAINAVLDAFQSAINTALSFLQAAITGDWSGLVRRILEAVLGLLGINPQDFYGVIGNALETIQIIVDNPIGFLGNCVNAVVGGFRRFAGNFLSHLRRGIIGWLTGALGDIQIPERFDLLGLLDLGRQILGLTWDWLRRKAARIIGERNVERLEFAYDWIQTVVTEGWQGLFRRVREELGNLRDQVLEGIRNFLVERIVMAGIQWLASLFGPVGAIVRIILTIWNFIMFLRDQLSNIIEVARTVIASIGNIARGVIAQAAEGVETVLGRLLPIVIDLVARLLGLGNVARPVRRLIGRVRQRIDRAVDRLIRRVLARFTRRRGRRRDRRDRRGDSRTIRVGDRLTVQEPGGPRHTLFIQVRGRDATIVLNPNPTPMARVLAQLRQRANGLEDQNNKRRANEKIDSATNTLRRLDPAADAYLAAQTTGGGTRGTRGASSPAAPAASQSTIRRLHRSLRADLTAAYEIISPGTGEEAVIAAFQPEIDRVQAELRSLIVADLQSRTGRRLGTWRALREHWEERDAVKYPLRRTHTIGVEIRSTINAILDRLGRDSSVEVAIPDAANRGAFLDYLAQRFNRQSGPHVTTLNAVKSYLFNTTQQTRMHEALERYLATTVEEYNARGESATQRLIDAISSKRGVVPFLKGVADNEFPPSYTRSQWNDDKRDTTNRRYIARRFRAARAARHEWIPINYISDLVTRAKNEEDPDKMAVSSEWIDFANQWRTRTQYLIFNPRFPEYQRSVNEGPNADSDDVLQRWSRGGDYRVLQGHTGAVYAPVSDSGARSDVVPQSKGEGAGSTRPGTFHGEIRSIFDRHRSTATTITGVRRIAADVNSMVSEHIWDGSPHGARAFTEYYPGTRSQADKGGIFDESRLANLAGGAHGQIMRNTRSAFEVLIP